MVGFEFPSSQKHFTRFKVIESKNFKVDLDQSIDVIGSKFNFILIPKMFIKCDNSF